MITPNGRVRDQVSQGAMQNQSIFNADFLNKIKVGQAEKALERQKQQEQERGQTPKDLKMDELQQTMMDSDSSSLSPEKFSPPPRGNEPPGGNEPGNSKQKPNVNPGVGGEFIDISKQISQKVIDALGLNKRPNEMWQGKTEITNDGDEVTGITIKLTKAMPKDMVGPAVTKNGPPYPQSQTQTQQQPQTRM